MLQLRPGNDAKDVTARKFSRLLEEQANTISKIKQSKTVFFVLFWYENFINKRVTLNKLKQVLNHIKIKD